MITGTGVSFLFQPIRLPKTNFSAVIYYLEALKKKKSIGTSTV